MTLRQFLRSWLRELRATAVAVDRALLMQRRSRLAYRYRSIETLLVLPTVEPDRSHHRYPPTEDIEAGAEWLALAYPRTWGRCTVGLRELHVGIWLGRRADVRQEEHA